MFLCLIRCFEVLGTEDRNRNRRKFTTLGALRFSSGALCRRHQDNNIHFDNPILSTPLGLIGSLHEGTCCLGKAGALAPTYIATNVAWSKGIAHLTGAIHRHLV